MTRKRNGGAHGLRIAAGFAAAMLLIPAAGAMAQPERAREEMREDLRETVEIYMLARMKRELALDEEQQQAIVPLIEEMNASRRRFQQERRRLMMRLHPLVETGGEDAEFRALLDGLYAAERDHRDLEERNLAAVRRALTPGQEARFLLFMERFRREMEDRVRGLMQDGGPPGPRRGDRPFPPRGNR